MPRPVYYKKRLTRNLACKGEQSQLAGAFYCIRNFALVLCAGTRLTARADFTIVTHITAKQFYRLVIDQDTFVGAELANARLSVKPLSTVLGFVRRIFVRHV
jgi:hypothetical protein